MQEDDLRIETGDDDVVQRPAAGLEGDDEGPAFAQVIFDVVPFGAESVGLEAIVLEVALHGGSKDAARLRGEKLVVDGLDIGSGPGGVAGPVVDDHGDGSGAATIRRLRHEGDFEGDRRRMGYSSNTEKGE